ncbi:MAG: hypothetical protein JJ896_07045 [Rhodothermales bacterium]|nr:hypothetical protein [Rhodothermales bacterium]MBO6779394.1 hypothetical protein [Rhodothermales bacterium]
MDTIQLPSAFSDILRLLNAHEVRYLVIGGFAVAYHGYPRATGDIDIWIDPEQGNAARVHASVVELGFDLPSLRVSDFSNPDRVVRLGYPPMRIEFMTRIPGVMFADCFGRRVVADFNGVETSLIGLACLRANKVATGRSKDLNDLEHLPESTHGL